MGVRSVKKNIDYTCSIFSDGFVWTGSSTLPHLHQKNEAGIYFQPHFILAFIFLLITCEQVKQDRVGHVNFLEFLSWVDKIMYELIFCIELVLV